MVKIMSRYIIDANTFKRIKSLDFTEMNDWLNSFYMSAYNAGKQSVKGIDSNELISKLSSIKGIGKQTLTKIQQELK